MKKSGLDYIVIEGPIGVGKTSLATRLAETFNTDLVLEQAFENPFLPQFYNDPKSSALPTQLYFLFQRSKQIEKIRQTDIFRPVHISDFIIEKDRLFAEVTLTQDEYELYMQVYDRLSLDVPSPDLVIYLQAPVDTLLQRISERGIDYERFIDEEYLKKISDAYINFFYDYQTSPLLIVNTADFNLVGDDKNYQLLIDYINDLSPGRHYFNPIQL